MSQERRYDDEEADRIFALAARTDSAEPRRPDGDGLTLRQLQEIGGEAGIDPDRVAEAARAIEARGRRLPEKKSLGMVVSAGQVAPLPRGATDEEWNALVTELRDVFGATGEVHEQGGARVWSNGALRVLIEPTVQGYQLRMTTTNRRFRSLNRIGAMLAVWGLVFGAIVAPELFAGDATLLELLRGLLPSAIVAGAGLGFVGFSGLSLPKWVDERQHQFERVSGMARGILAKPAEAQAEPPETGA